MVIYEIVNAVKTMLSNSDSPQLEAELLVMETAKMSRADFIINSRTELDKAVTEKIFAAAKRRSEGEPLAYILGNAEFMGLKFYVNSDTLIPRADTEVLVENAVELIGDKHCRVLDIGTGSGCIGISIAKYCKNAEVVLLDINENALATAVKNAEANGVRIKADVCDILSEIPEGQYDVIVSNPPYIRDDVIPGLQTEVKDFEPIRALSGGCDGLKFYRRISDIAFSMLSPNGILAFEIGYDQGNDVKNIMSLYADVRIIRDYCGNDRVAIGTRI